MGLETSDGCYFEHLTKEGNRELTHHMLLQYHTSWDWLKPVINKIEQVCEGVPEQMLHVSLYTPIEEIYEAVVTFLKIYNDERTN